MTKPVRLAYLVSHPIQYQAPLLRRIAEERDIELTVFFGSDFSVRGYQDEGFGVDVKWDIPLLQGYRHEFLPAIRDRGTVSVTTPLNRGIFDRLRGRGGEPGFDVLWVHGYATVNAMHGMLAAKALGIPVLLRAESWLKDRSRHAAKLVVKQGFFRVLKGLVDGVLPIGSLNAAYWRYYFGADVPQFPMPYAVDNAYFRMRSEEARARQAELLKELGLEAGRPVILFASKLQARKRCADLVAAYANLVKAGRGNGGLLPYLLIVGDGEERTRLEEQVREEGLEGVRFPGFRNQSELPRFFDLADVFVLPSEHEPWGLIVNEVMNAGCAVIVSDDAGCQPDLITDGVEGCVFPVGDVRGLTNALGRVLGSPETAREMGQRGLERIGSWDFEADVRGLRTAIESVTRGLRV